MLHFFRVHNRLHMPRPNWPASRDPPVVGTMMEVYSASGEMGAASSRSVHVCHLSLEL